jgi:cytochrome c-type biogenesis protein
MNLGLSSVAVMWAGIISFLSPCVLPLVPPYLCFISGMSLEQLSASNVLDSRNRKPVMLAALAFVLGFTTVFVLLGAAASSIGQILRENLPVLAQLAGVFIILMGLNFLGVFKIGMFSREARYHQEVRPAGLLGAYAVGLAFAFGWTPCIGPILAAILSVAATEENLVKGMILLALYSLGLGIPFLLAAYSTDAFLRFFSGFRKHLGTVERIMGVALVLTGVMFLTGGLQWMAFQLLEFFPGLASLG